MPPRATAEGGQISASAGRNQKLRSTSKPNHPLPEPRGSFSLTGGRRAHIHAIDHTSDIVSYKIPPLTPRRRSPKGGTVQTPRHKSEGPRAVVGHDTVCCTRDSEPAKTRVFVTPCNREPTFQSAWQRARFARNSDPCAVHSASCLCAEGRALGSFSHAAAVRSVP